jgi:hypothetical protein
MSESFKLPVYGKAKIPGISQPQIEYRVVLKEDLTGADWEYLAKKQDLEGAGILGSLTKRQHDTHLLQLMQDYLAKKEKKQ